MVHCDMSEVRLRADYKCDVPLCYRTGQACATLRGYAFTICTACIERVQHYRESLLQYTKGWRMYQLASRVTWQLDRITQDVSVTKRFISGWTTPESNVTIILTSCCVRMYITLITSQSIYVPAFGILKESTYFHDHLCT